MNVLFMTIKPPLPANDGGNIASLNMMRAYNQQGHTVSLLTMITKKHPYIQEAWATTDCQISSVWTVPNNAQVKPIEALKNLLFSDLPYNAERFISQQFENKIVEILQNNDYDMIELEGLYLMPYANVIRNYSSATLILRSHNVEFEIWERKATEASLLKKAYVSLLAKRMKRFETSYINQYDLLLSITDRDLQYYNTLGNSKPSLTIPFGFDLPKVQANSMAPGDVCYIGALDWSPNQHGLLWFLDNCWEQIITKKPNIKLSVAGRNAPQLLIDKLLKYSSVEFHGEVDDAHQFMVGHRVMVAPLFSGSGMRVKMIEGMALGMPIVATPIAVEGIDTGNHEPFIVQESTDLFAENVLKLLDDTNERVYLSDQAVQCAHEKYGLESVCAPLWQLLDSEMNNHLKA